MKRRKPVAVPERYIGDTDRRHYRAGYAAGESGVPCPGGASRAMRDGWTAGRRAYDRGRQVPLFEPRPLDVEFARAVSAAERAFRRYSVEGGA